MGVSNLALDLAAALDPVATERPPLTAPEAFAQPLTWF